MTQGQIATAALVNRSAHAVFGVVSAVDPVNHAIKVRVQPDNIETGWIADIGGVQAGDLRIACPSEPGTHVVLLPIEGDAEHLVAVGAVFDTVVTAPVSPLDGSVIQPGELLIRAGCGEPPVENTLSVPVQKSAEAGWCQIDRQGVTLGAGNSRFIISQDQIVLTVGNVRAVLSASGLKVFSGDIQTEAHSLDNHIHLVGTQSTGGPIG
ncbi:baseplate assembly protein [Gluconobacter japonicus]|uniref:baseplate assembly protein n=1 Tax=Gluconobacter japonicus TaxID=376620 RepID=UPI001D1722CB|nr:baseplate assembly protein [Gluconobacter japonicus]